jgi:hypothetical protein
MSLKNLAEDIEDALFTSRLLGEYSEKLRFCSNLNDKRNYDEKQAERISKKMKELTEKLLEFKKKWLY